MTDLAAQTSLTTSGVTRVVDRLERDGLVRARGLPSDRRSSYAVITEAGRDRLDAVLPGHLELIDEWFTGLLDPAQLDGAARRPADDPGRGAPGRDSGCRAGRRTGRPVAPPRPLLTAVTGSRTVGHEVRIRPALGGRPRRRRPRRPRRAARLGRLLRLGAGLGRRRLGDARRRRDDHQPHPARHHAHPAAPAPAVGPGRPDRRPRQPQRRPGDPLRRARRGARRLARVRTRPRAPGTGPSCSTRGSTCSPDCGPASRSSTHGEHYQVTPIATSCHRHRRSSSRASRSGWSAAGPRRGRCGGPPATTAGCPTCSATGATGRPAPDHVRAGTEWIRDLPHRRRAAA